MPLKYVKPFKTPLKSELGDGETLSYLLWGDPVHVKDNNLPNSDWVEVMARSWDKGYIKRSDLQDNPILEIYIVDVGQGDGVLFKTPDNKWHLLDAGTTNSRQMTGKGAANFVRFKFIEDLRMEKVSLENLILSHPDLDHFGGMIDLLGGKLSSHPPFITEVANFYHNGLGRFKQPPKLGVEDEAGQIAEFPVNAYRLNKKPDFIRQLLNNKADFEANLSKFTEDYKKFASLLIEKTNNIARLSAENRFLPRYAQDNPQIQIRVLGPIVETYNGNKQGLRKFGSEPKTVNGHSIVLRIDYGLVKILLTGDLNEELSKTPAQLFAQRGICGGYCQRLSSRIGRRIV